MKKKLIEVALPLEAINEASRREKSPFTKNHPRVLHVWWARRPLAACRAVLFASLVDDPSADLLRFPTEDAQLAERRRLFKLIEDLVRWENHSDESLLRQAEKEILASTNGKPPCVLDPFSGGGSIPIEAQRLGLDAIAGDLNPVAVLINKALTELPAKFAGISPINPVTTSRSRMQPKYEGIEGLIVDLEYYADWFFNQAQERLQLVYPAVELPKEFGYGAAPVSAWIWARTVTCPNPACGGSAPLIRSFDLSTKAGNEFRLSVSVDNSKRTCSFRVEKGAKGHLEPTVGKRGATCLICSSPISLVYIRNEGKAGRIGNQLMAVVASVGKRRVYLDPDSKQSEAAACCPAPSGAPDTALPAHALGFRVQAYGIGHHSSLFTPRQLTAMVALTDLVVVARDQVLKDGGDSNMPTA